MKLFLLLCAGLLLAGTVEAGREIGEDRWWHHINPPKSMLGTTGNELFLCDIGKPCKASYEAVGCYQRMQAAMQLMDRWLEDAKLGNVTFQGGIYPNVKLHWDDVMRECVRQ